MCTRYPIINRVSELKVHIKLTRFVQPEKIEIDANERAVNEKSPYCFFVCTTFDSFLNDLFGIVSSAVVALVIYFISYNEIDDRKIKREDNAKDTAKVLLADTYKECLNTLELLGNREILEAFIVPKVDFNKTNKDDKIMNNLQTLPFESFDKIISLSEGGYISKDKLEIYLSIKKEFALVVSMKITFFDIDKAQGLKQILYKEEIDRRFYDLINTINNEISFLTNR